MLSNQDARVVRNGTLLALHLVWSVIAGFLALLIGWALATLVAGAIPLPRRDVVAGAMTALALAAGWAAPAAVARLAAIMPCRRGADGSTAPRARP